MVTAAALLWTLMPTPPALRIRVRTFVVLCFCLPLAGAIPDLAGRKIAAIRFDPALQPLPDAELAALLPVKVGDRYSAAAVRQAIQKLYATGEYTDVAVDASEEPNGLVLKFITAAATFVGRVSVRGAAEPPGDGQLETLSRLELGAEYAPPDVQQALENMQDSLRRNGLYRATVTPFRIPHPLTQEMDVIFTVDSGKRAHFDGLTVTGDPEEPLADIVRHSGWKGYLFGWGPWRGVTDARVQSGVDSVRSFYEKQDRLLAHVVLTRLDFHPETNRVTPTLDIIAGPLVRVNVEGAHISRGKLRTLLPVYEERAVDEDLLIEGRKNLVDYMQSQGYFDAEAGYRTSAPQPGEQVITYTVQRGGRHKFVKLQITGNHYFSMDTIRERMYLQPATLIRFRHGRYSREYVARDLDAIRDLYRSNGFRDVEVTEKTVDNYDGRRDRLAVLVNIKEGPQWFVSHLQLNGVSPEDAAKIRPLLHSGDGQPFSEQNVAADRDVVLDYYYNNGYPDATFDYADSAAAEPDHMDVAFTVHPGPRQFVRQVLVMGLDETNPDFVDRRISLKSGDPISAEQMRESQRRLYDLGIFSKVQTGLQNPDGVEPSKYVLYDVDEAHKYSINTGFGAEIAR